MPPVSRGNRFELKALNNGFINGWDLRVKAFFTFKGNLKELEYISAEI